MNSLTFNKLPRGKTTLSWPTLLKSIVQLPFMSQKRGKESQEFESNCASYFERNHAIAISSCRVAFYYYLKHLKLPKGSEVLLTPLTIPDMVNAIIINGLKPVFVDMSRSFNGVDLSDLKRKTSTKSKVFLLTYLCGHVPEISIIKSFCDQHKILMCEDVSQASGASYQNKKLGSFGHASFISLSLTKPLTSIAGGVFLTDDSMLFKNINDDVTSNLKSPSSLFLWKQALYFLFIQIVTSRIIFSFFTYYGFLFLSLFGQQDKTKIHTVRKNLGGYEKDDYYKNPPILRNKMPKESLFLMSDFQCSIANSILNKLDFNNSKRVESTKAFLNKLTPKALETVDMHSTDQGESIFYHLSINCKNYKSKLQKYLLLNNIDTTSYALKLNSNLECFKEFNCDTPKAKDIVDNTIFMPTHDSFSIGQMEQAAEVYNTFINNEVG